MEEKDDKRNQEKVRQIQRQRDQADGVCLEGGEMTYNITTKNLKQAHQQIMCLTEENGHQK